MRPLALALLGALACAGLSPDRLLWQAAPSPYPAGTEIAFVSGHPRQPGPFVVQLRLPAGAELPAHVHPAEERTTVIAGAVRISYPESGAAATYTEGQRYAIAVGRPHAAFSEGGCTLEVHGTGPWAVEFVNR